MTTHSLIGIARKRDLHIVILTKQKTYSLDYVQPCEPNARPQLQNSLKRDGIGGKQCCEDVINDKRDKHESTKT